MKLSTTIGVLLASALIPESGAARAETVIGPGVVAPLDVSGDYRYLSGTEIVATEPRGVAFFVARSAVQVAYSGTHVFEGGYYRGMTVAAGAASTEYPGSAIDYYQSSDATLVLYDGLFRGGSSFTNAPNSPGAPGIRLNPRYHSRLVLFGGVVEGGHGLVDGIPKQAPAIVGQGYYDYSREQIDIYGGTLVGGVSIHGMSRFTVHGSNLAISPDPTGPFYSGMDFTLTGNYANGAPFSHTVRADPYYYGYLIKTPDSITIESYIPEPSAMGLMLVALIPLRSLRSRRSLHPTSRLDDLT